MLRTSLFRIVIWLIDYLSQIHNSVSFGALRQNSNAKRAALPLAGSGDEDMRSSSESSAPGTEACFPLDVSRVSVVTSKRTASSLPSQTLSRRHVTTVKKVRRNVAFRSGPERTTMVFRFGAGGVLCLGATFTEWTRCLSRCWENHSKHYVRARRADVT